MIRSFSRPMVVLAAAIFISWPVPTLDARQSDRSVPPEAARVLTDIKKIEDPEGGHRAVITLNGKFLPLKPF